MRRLENSKQANRRASLGKLVSLFRDKTGVSISKANPAQIGVLSTNYSPEDLYQSCCEDGAHYVRNQACQRPCGPLETNHLRERGWYPPQWLSDHLDVVHSQRDNDSPVSKAQATLGQGYHFGVGGNLARCKV